MSLSAELITSIEAFERLGVEWNELVDDMEKPEVFYRWEWNFHFHRRCSTGEELFIVLVREAPSGRLVGIAPLCLRRVRALGIGVVSAGTIIAGLADYQNFLVRARVHRGKVVEAILDLMAAHHRRWDVIDLHQFCSRDPTTFQIVRCGQLRHEWTVRTHIQTAVATRDLRLGRAVDDPGRLRRVRNRLKRLQESGLDLRIDCADFDGQWDAFCELHRKTWPDSPLHDDRQRAFFADLVASRGMAGKLDLSVAYLDGRLAAAHFGFADGNKAFFYMPAMDRAFHRERVGAALLYALVEHYAKTRTTFDFMRTVADYKTWYTDSLDVNYRIVMQRNTSFAAFAYGFLDVSRRFFVELGLPRAVVRRLKGQRDRDRPDA